MQQKCPDKAKQQIAVEGWLASLFYSASSLFVLH